MGAYRVHTRPRPQDRTQRLTRATRGRTLLRQQLCLHPTPLRCDAHHCELSSIVCFHDLVHRDERVEQVAVFLDISPRDNAGTFRDDETAIFQQTNMLCNGVAREVQSLCDGRFARMTLVRLAVRVAQLETRRSDVITAESIFC